MGLYWLVIRYITLLIRLFHPIYNWWRGPSCILTTNYLQFPTSSTVQWIFWMYSKIQPSWRPNPLTFWCLVLPKRSSFRPLKANISPENWKMALPFDGFFSGDMFSFEMVSNFWFKRNVGEKERKVMGKIYSPIFFQPRIFNFMFSFGTKISSTPRLTCIHVCADLFNERDCEVEGWCARETT